MRKDKQRRPNRWVSGLGGMAVASLGLCGCAGFWDEVTSRNFEVSHLFTKPNPFLVLQDSKDGDERARALRALREPKQHGGNDKDQEAILKILAVAATTDRQPLCRLAAVHSLGTFKDPRAVDALTQAFENAPFEKPYDRPPKQFRPETSTIIQSQTLLALGETHNPAAVDLLVRVAREPAPASSVNDDEKQQWVDRHIAAVRALGNFPQSQATEALVQVLQKEKNVALHDRAQESLEHATGKKVPPDAKAWEEALHAANQKDAPKPDDNNPIRRVFGHASE
jgi:HEAT repeat protein